MFCIFIKYILTLIFIFKSQQQQFMDTLKVFCPTHQDQVIQFVNIAPCPKQDLYCANCFVKALQDDEAPLTKDIKTIPVFIEAAANFYAHNQPSIKVKSLIPKEFPENSLQEQLQKNILNTLNPLFDSKNPINDVPKGLVVNLLSRKNFL